MKSFRAAFTLIELLITIAIISVLAGIVVVSLTGEVDVANDAALKGSVASLRPAALSASYRSSTTDLCSTIRGRAKAGKSHFATWTTANHCSLTQGDETGEICCASSGATEWVIWGRLSTFSSDTGNPGGDYFCADDDEFSDVIDHDTLIVSGSNYRCK